MKKQHEHVIEEKNISGVRVRECRKALGLTQEELASKVYELPENKGTSRTPEHIGYIERGQRNLSHEWAWLLAKALGVRPEYLLGEDNCKTESEFNLMPVQKDIMARHAVASFLLTYGITFNPPLDYEFFTFDEIADMISTMRLEHTIDIEDILPPDCVNDTPSGIIWRLRTLHREIYDEIYSKALKIILDKYSQAKYAVFVNEKNVATLSSSDVCAFIEEFRDYAYVSVQRLFTKRNISIPPTIKGEAINEDDG